MKETTRPMRRTIHRSLFMTTWAAVPAARAVLLGWISLSRSQHVAAIMVGMESRKLNSRAVGRSRPANWPLAIVDMEREVPGKMAERVWQRPIQMAWPSPISSTWRVVDS